MRVERSDGSTYTRYFHKDHLGSIATITDETGAVVERLSYGAWGKRRFPNGQDDPTGSISSQTTRGFTGQEELADVGLVHMNGRVYDPLLGRFGTPDPTTENPFSTQGWNRYSYVGNSPLNFTDPSGYCFAGCFWQAPFKALGGLLRRVPILGNILTIAAAAFCGPGFSVCAVAASSITSAVVTGLASGKLGLALKAGFISAATAVAMYEAGELTGNLGLAGAPNGGHGQLNFLQEAHLFNIAAHAAVGCLSAIASRGKCGPGALAGAIGSFSSNLPFAHDFETGLIVTTVSGGLASIAGGGKFGNGAVTAAFGYLYNGFENSKGSGGLSRIPSDIYEFALDLLDDPLGALRSLGPSLAGLGMAVPVGGSVAEGAAETTPLFRAVTTPELESIQSLNAFSNPAGIEVKYFSTSLEGAQSYASQATSAFGDGPFSFVQTSIPTSSITPEMSVTVDRGIQTIVVPTGKLPGLSEPVILGRP